MPELTLRALLAGCVLGAALSAANVYAGLKIGSADGGSITASVLAFAIFSGKARSALPYSKLENNFTQTVASSAAVMSMVVGVAGPVPALAMTGYTMSPLVLMGFGITLSALGTVLGVLLHPRLSVAEGLPFPTGRATGEVISAMEHGSAGATLRARALFVAALFAGAVTLLRDGPLPIIPQELVWAGSFLGFSVTSLSLRVSVSPLMFATGMMSGMHAAASMVLGSAIGWLAVVPALVDAKVIAEGDQGATFNWLMWPGAALILAGSLVSLMLQWRGVLRGVRDLYKLVTQRARPHDQTGDAASRPHTSTNRLLLSLLSFVCVGVILLLGHGALGLGFGTLLAALALSVVLSTVSGRAAGETDIAPVGTMGGITQLLFGAGSQTASLGCGAIVAGQASGTAQMLWALESGRYLKASVRAQVIGQMIGSVVGALVVVPTYEIVTRAYPVGSPQLPAPGAMSWKATADAVQSGMSALPSHATTAAFVAMGVGCVLTLLATTRIGRFVPSPVAMGIAFLLPPSLSATMFLGALTLLLVGRRSPAWAERYGTSIAGGALAGESLIAVLLAALICLGVLQS